MSAPAAPAPNRCPLCGRANRCAMESGRAAGLEQPPCWCVEADFDPALLAQLPAEARRKACICEACARRHGATNSLDCGSSPQ